jgi:hypothetical protein
MMCTTTVTCAQVVTLGKDFSTGALAKHLRGHKNIPAMEAELAKKISSAKDKEAKNQAASAGKRKYQQQTILSTTKTVKKARYTDAVVK